MLIDGVILKLQAGLDAGVGVYEDVLPREYTFPAVVIHDYSGTREQSMITGPVNDEETNLQFDVYGETALQARQVRAAIQTLLEGFTGRLLDGTTVTGSYLERKMSLPFLPQANVKAIGFRKLLGLRFVSKV